MHPKIALAFAGMLICTDAAFAATRTWPGPLPCNGSFAECLAGAQAGDTVRIVSSANITDRIDLDRPVSIEAAPGAVPSFVSSELHRFTLAGTETWAMSLRGLKFVGGSVRFAIGGPQPGHLLIDRSSFSGNASDSQTQIQFGLSQTSSSRSSIVISASEFEIGSDNGAPFSISQFGSSPGGMDLLLEDNRFRPEPVLIPQSFHRALFLNPAGNSDWDVVIRRNQILPARALPARRYASGFELNSNDSVRLNLTAHDNVIVLDDVAGAGGVGIAASGGSGPITARVLNNTILHASYGVHFGINASGRFDNNVLAHGFRMHDGAAPAASFTQRANLIHNFVDASNWPTAPGTVTGDPMLSDKGSPRPGAPVLDAGSAIARAEIGPGSYGVPEARDANRLRRLEGLQIDIGAVEGERMFYDGNE